MVFLAGCYHLFTYKQSDKRERKKTFNFCNVLTPLSRRDVTGLSR
jgi:hypothetical protein